MGAVGAARLEPSFNLGDKKIEKSKHTTRKDNRVSDNTFGNVILVFV